MDTFKERLDEHNEYCSEAMEKARELLEHAKRAEAARKLWLDEAQTIIEELEERTREFDETYRDELWALGQVCVAFKRKQDLVPSTCTNEADPERDEDASEREPSLISF